MKPEVQSYRLWLNGRERGRVSAWSPEQAARRIQAQGLDFVAFWTLKQIVNSLQVMEGNVWRAIGNAR